MLKRVVCAANKHRDGVVVLGVRHWDMFMVKSAKSLLGEPIKGSEWEQGFVDQLGRFLTREEAWAVAEEAGQIIRDVDCPGVLYSENLY